MTIDEHGLHDEPAWDDINSEDTPDADAYYTAHEGGLMESPSFQDDPVRDVRQWYLLVEEDCENFDRGDRISGQFTAQQVTQNVGASIAEAGGFSRESPIIQWVGGMLKDWTFQARLFSDGSRSNIAADKLERLELLTKRDRSLGRPPLVSFFWGIAIPDGFPCMVDSLGGIVYDELRDDGSMRGATLSITLKKFTPFRIEQVAAQSTQRTPQYVVKDGDTYELIAKRMYGDPLFGILLRRKNGRSPMVPGAPAGIADLVVGDKIKVFPRRDMLLSEVVPECHLLRMDSFLSSDLRRYYFETRGRKRAVMPPR